MSARGLFRVLAAFRTAAVVALLAFHGWLLWDRVADGRLLETAALLRWGVSIPLLAALLALRRSGRPLFRGRAALTVWLLVALLHVVAAPSYGPFVSDTHPENPLTFVVPSIAGPLVLGLGLALAGLALRRLGAPLDVFRRREAIDELFGLSAGWRHHLSPRAPPALPV